MFCKRYSFRELNGGVLHTLKPEGPYYDEDHTICAGMWDSEDAALEALSAYVKRMEYSLYTHVNLVLVCHVVQE